MRAIRLVAMPDEYNDSLGFVLKGCASFEGLSADRDGILTAHDVLEHQNGIEAMGPVWDEMEALGAIWYVRGQWGDMMTDRPSYHSAESNVASDVERMFMQWVCEDMGAQGPGGFRAGSRPHDQDEYFGHILDIARDQIKREQSDGWNDDRDDDATLEDYLAFALRRFRIGFRKAQHRFERDGASQFFAGNTFCAVRDAVRDAVRHIEWEGQEFILRYGNAEALCYEAPYREEY